MLGSLQDIDYKEFEKRGEAAPFSAQPATVTYATEAEIQAVDPQDENKGMVIPGGCWELSIRVRALLHVCVCPPVCTHVCVCCVQASFEHT